MNNYEKSGSSKGTYRNNLKEDYNTNLKKIQPCTQRYDVAEHLIEHGSITSMTAIKQYGCTRLSAVIYELRKNGFNIETVDKDELNRYGNVVTFAEYVLNRKESKDDR